MDGTVIGDSVNLAARLEGLTKFYRVQCLISKNTFAQLSTEAFQIRRMDKVKVKGKAEPVEIFELMGAGETVLRVKKLSSQDRFEQAIDAFQTGRFTEARNLFASVSAEMAEDRAAAMYIERCDRFIANPPPADWDGALQLDTK